jgi:hypothetical protein
MPQASRLKDWAISPSNLVLIVASYGENCNRLRANAPIGACYFFFRRFRLLLLRLAVAVTRFSVDGPVPVALS